MRQTQIAVQPADVGRALRRFDVKIADFAPIVEAVVGARAMAVQDDPRSAAGQFAYIYGVRHTRRAFRRKGWTIDRSDNIEAVRSPDSGILIVYQNVDQAGVPAVDPLALSGKRSGSRRQVDEAQGTLFSEVDLPQAYRPVPGVAGLVFYLCVSVEQVSDGLLVGAELSLPRPFTGDNFDGFYERIIVRPNGPWDGGEVSIFDSADAIEIKPTVTRKAV